MDVYVCLSCTCVYAFGGTDILICRNHWLIRKLHLPMAGQNIGRREIQTKIQEEEGWSWEDTHSWWGNTRHEVASHETHGKI